MCVYNLNMLSWVCVSHPITNLLPLLGMLRFISLAIATSGPVTWVLPSLCKILLKIYTRRKDEISSKSPCGKWYKEIFVKWKGKQRVLVHECRKTSALVVSHFINKYIHIYILRRFPFFKFVWICNGLWFQISFRKHNSHSFLILHLSMLYSFPWRGLSIWYKLQVS